MTNQFDSDMYNYDIDEQPDFEDALNELKSDNEQLPGDTILYGLSELTADEIDRLQEVWDTLAPAYRQILMQTMVDNSQSNFELDYRRIGYANLDADQAEVRRSAIEILGEQTDTPLMKRLVEMMYHDESVDVRAEAAKALGRFVLAGEFGDFTEERAEKLQNHLLVVAGNQEEAMQVRRRALESIGNCTRSDVPPLIYEAYTSGDDETRVSAMIAMGRTCDSKRWQDIVLEELESGDNAMRHAAAVAAGELQLEAAVRPLGRLIEDDTDEIRDVAIEALGEIGGDEALQILYAVAEVAEAKDDALLAEKADDAINMATLMSGELLMMDFSDIDMPETDD
jgi:hypothetical protein